MPFTTRTFICLLALASKALSGPVARPQVSQGALVFTDEGSPDAPVVISSDLGELPVMIAQTEIEEAVTTTPEVVETAVVSATSASVSTSGVLTPTSTAEVVEAALVSVTTTPEEDAAASAAAIPEEVIVAIQPEEDVVATTISVDVTDPELINCITVGFSDDDLPIKMCLGPLEGALDADMMATLAGGKVFDGFQYVPRPIISGDICEHPSPLSYITDRPEYSSFVDSFLSQFQHNNNSGPKNQELLDFIGTSCSLFNSTDPAAHDLGNEIKTSNKSCFTTEGWVEEYLGNEIENIHFSNSTDAPSIRQTNKGFFKKVTYTKMDLCLEEEFEALSGKLGVVDPEDMTYLPCGCRKTIKHHTGACSCDIADATTTAVATVYETDAAGATVTIPNPVYATVTDESGAIATVTLSNGDISTVTYDSPEVTVTASSDNDDDESAVATVTASDDAVVTVTADSAAVTVVYVDDEEDTIATTTVTGGPLATATATIDIEALAIEPGDFVFNPVASSNDEPNMIVIDEEEVDVFVSQVGTATVPVSTSTESATAKSTATVSPDTDEVDVVYVPEVPEATGIVIDDGAAQQLIAESEGRNNMFWW